MKFKLLILLSRFLNRLPHRFRVALGASLGAIWFHLLRFRRGVVLENLRTAFGREKSEAEIREIARLNFRHYGLTLIEIAQSISWTQEDYRREVPAHGIENLRQALAKGRGVFGLTCHLGNWEWVIGAVMARGIPGDVVVKHSKNPSLDRFLTHYRENMGIGVFFESGTAKDVLRSLSKGKLVGFILDQFMGPPIGLPVKFFGHPAGTAIGLALLTEKKDTPIVPIYSYRDESDRLITVIDPEIQMPAFSENREDRLYEKTQLYNDVLEARIRQHPDQWLWLHRRWKEYRGEPRWKPSAAIVATAFLFTLLTGCVSTQTEDTYTGIALPADPQVNLPDANVVEAAPVATVVVNDPAPPPTVGTTVAPPKAKTVAKAKPSTPDFNPRVFTPAQLPFEVGERMELALNWSALKAGTVKLDVREGFPFQGRPTYKLWGRVESSKLVDAIYHIENTIESYIDKQWLLPYKFLLHMSETAQLKETRAAFDHKLQKVHYWSERISEKMGNDKQNRVDKMLPLANDMYSAIYYARVLEYEIGKPVQFPIYENGQNLMVTLLPVGKEVIQTPAGVFQCWKLQVTVKVNNILKPTGEPIMWLSDDSKRYLVRFDAKLKYGFLRGELQSVRERL